MFALLERMVVLRLSVYKIEDENVTIGDLSENALNIRIIRNAQYYKNNGFEDEYCKDKKYLIHHITIDDFSIKLEKTTGKEENKKTKPMLSSPAIDVILKESYIKNDIKQGKITILNWTLGEWLFMREYEKGYQMLKITNNGSLVFENCPENQRFATESYNHYVAIFKQNNKYNGKDCLLVCNHQDVNLIFDTPSFTIQEIEKIGETLELEAQEIDLTKEQILAMLNEFVADNPAFASNKNLKKTIQEIENFREKLSKSKLNSIFEDNGLTNRTKVKKAFCDFYAQTSVDYLEQKDVLHHFFKSEKAMEKLFASNTNIYYQMNSEFEAVYFVGKTLKQVQTSFQNATNIRKIKAVRNLDNQPSKLVFDQLLQTMAVDFVKQGDMTVLPFPFKYLREISK